MARTEHLHSSALTIGRVNKRIKKLTNKREKLEREMAHDGNDQKLEKYLARISRGLKRAERRDGMLERAEQKQRGTALGMIEDIKGDGEVRPGIKKDRVVKVEDEEADDMEMGDQDDVEMDEEIRVKSEDEDGVRGGVGFAE